MIPIPQSSPWSIHFMMVDSSDNVTGVTSLTFGNSGNIQVCAIGSNFVDITSACGVVELTRAGLYRLTCSAGTFNGTLGEYTVSIYETNSGSAVPFDRSYLVTNYNVSSVAAQVTSLAAQVSSVGVHVNSIDAQVDSVAAQVNSTYAYTETVYLTLQGTNITLSNVANAVDSVYTQTTTNGVAVFSLGVEVGSMYNLVQSFDQYKADVSTLVAGVGQGTVIIPAAAVTSGTPIKVYAGANFNGTFYLSGGFSSHVASGYQVWLTAKADPRDVDSNWLWSVQGSVPNVGSMGAVFSLANSETVATPSRYAQYEVQFRNSSQDMIAVAMTGGLELLEMLKRRV